MGIKGGDIYPLFRGQEIWFASDKIRYAIITDHLVGSKTCLIAVTREDGAQYLIPYELAVLWDNSNYQIQWEDNECQACS
jgi:hypothetical protein